MGKSGGNAQIAEAVKGAEWDRARYLVACKLAEALDRTESARDSKALAISLNQLIDKCEAARIGMDGAETPLDAILQAAEDLRAGSGSGEPPAHEGR